MENLFYVLREKEAINALTLLYVTSSSDISEDGTNGNTIRATTS